MPGLSPLLLSAKCYYNSFPFPWYLWWRPRTAHSCWRSWTLAVTALESVHPQTPSSPFNLVIQCLKRRGAWWIVISWRMTRSKFSMLCLSRYSLYDSVVPSIEISAHPTHLWWKLSPTQKSPVQTQFWSYVCIVTPYLLKCDDLGPLSISCCLGNYCSVFGITFRTKSEVFCWLTVSLSHFPRLQMIMK